MDQILPFQLISCCDVIQANWISALVPSNQKLLLRISDNVDSYIEHYDR